MKEEENMKMNEQNEKMEDNLRLYELMQGRGEGHGVHN